MNRTLLIDIKNKAMVHGKRLLQNEHEFYNSICNKNPKRNLEILVLQKQRQDAEICVFPQNTWHAKYLACKKLNMQKKKKILRICISLMICSFFLIANIWLNVNIRMTKKMTGISKVERKIPSVTSKLCQNFQEPWARILRGQ